MNVKTLYTALSHFGAKKVKQKLRICESGSRNVCAFFPGEQEPTRSACKPPFAHLVVGVRVQQGRLHVDGGSGGIEDHVVHILLHHLRVSWILGPLGPPLAGARRSGGTGK